MSHELVRHKLAKAHGMHAVCTSYHFNGSPCAASLLEYWRLSVSLAFFMVTRRICCKFLAHNSMAAPTTDHKREACAVIAK